LQQTAAPLLVALDRCDILREPPTVLLVRAGFLITLAQYRVRAA
jgi:hypothetical protein